MPPPAPHRRAQALTCRHGHYRWTDWHVVPLAEGYGVRAVCDLGDHWLSLGIAPEPAIVSLALPFAWTDEAEAERALATWAEQQQQEEREERGQ